MHIGQEFLTRNKKSHFHGFVYKQLLKALKLYSATVGLSIPFFTIFKTNPSFVCLDLKICQNLVKTRLCVNQVHFSFESVFIIYLVY